ncbi:hypothetical protein [Bryobacter aggregatus]|uniref:hypothetical protein n=1 Tax=Bryobacter aggregatus TaxID=360054 RepID=UPI0006904FEA|nr:hypothetical protein [Bryobacter aggregatus]
MKLLFCLVSFSLLASAQDYLLLSDVLKEVSDKPEFINTLVDRFGVLDAEQVTKLRGYIRDKQWKMVDSFPGLTVKELGRSIRLAGKLLPKPKPEHSETIDFTVPPLKDLGYGLAFGDEVDPKLAPLHKDSVELATRLNEPHPEKLLAELQQSGHTVEIRDARYFSNFGDLKYKGRDVLTPFWLDTGIPIPGQKRNLLVPAPHSQHAILVNGPKYQAALCFYFGIDGRAIVRPIDTKDQGWVMGHVAHVYQGAQALEAMRMIGEVIRVYAAIQKANPDLPFGGYYVLGVCNDPGAIVEMKMTGKTTLYPLTLDRKYFAGQGEVTEIVNQLPQDEVSTDKARVIASMPVDDLKQIPIASLRSDLLIVRSAPDVAPRGFSPWLALGFLPILIGGYFIWRSFSAASR